MCGGPGAGLLGDRPQVRIKCENWRKLGQQNHVQSLQEIISHDFFFFFLNFLC